VAGWLGGLAHRLADSPLEDAAVLADLDSAKASLEQRDRALGQPHNEALEVGGLGRRQRHKPQGLALAAVLGLGPGLGSVRVLAIALDIGSEEV
jgi:hypothetical protein